jgi:hypothetical protein
MRGSRAETGALERRGVLWGLVGVAIVVAITFIGSDGLVWFDAALIGYLFGIVFMVFGVAYRYTVWVQRPPTAMLRLRGREAFRRRTGRNAAALPGCCGACSLSEEPHFEASSLR